MKSPYSFLVKVVVEIKPTTTEEKVEQAVCEGHEKGEIKVKSAPKKEEKQVETKEVKKDEKVVKENKDPKPEEKK